MLSRIRQENVFPWKPNWKENAGNTCTRHISDRGVLHPQAGECQYYGLLWEWTASHYLAHPCFKPWQGRWVNTMGNSCVPQWILRGGSCVKPLDYICLTDHNFFYPHIIYSKKKCFSLLLYRSPKISFPVTFCVLPHRLQSLIRYIINPARIH